MEPSDPLRAVDLNLLVHLAALLEERSVTRAAARLGLTQPSASASLRRLRGFFGDPLLVRVGHVYELSPLAAQLAPLTRDAIVGAEKVFGRRLDFDPRHSERIFGLLATDAWLAGFGGPLAQTISQEAPNAGLRLRVLTSAALGSVVEAARTSDLIIAPSGSLSGLSSEPLITTRLVCVVDAAHPTIQDRLTIDDLRRLPWIMVAAGPAHAGDAAAPSFAMSQLAQYGIAPRIRCTTESACALPDLVRGSDCIAFMQEPLARVHAKRFGLRLLEAPIPTDGHSQAIWWHPQHERDAGHAWLRGHVHAIALLANASSIDETDSDYCESDGPDDLPSA